MDSFFQHVERNDFDEDRQSYCTLLDQECELNKERPPSTLTNTTLLNPLTNILDKLDRLELAELSFADESSMLIRIVSQVKDVELQAELVHDCLASFSPNVNYTDPTGKTALMHAVYHGVQQTVDVLLAADDISLTATDNEGNSALIIACLTGRTEIAAKLLAKAEQSLSPAQALRFVHHKNNSDDNAEAISFRNGNADCLVALREFIAMLHNEMLVSSQQSSLDIINVVDYDGDLHKSNSPPVNAVKQSSSNNFWAKIHRTRSNRTPTAEVLSKSSRSSASRSPSSNRYLSSENQAQQNCFDSQGLDALSISYTSSDFSSRPCSATMKAASQESLEKATDDETAHLSYQIVLDQGMEYWREQMKRKDTAPNLSNKHRNYSQNLNHEKSQHLAHGRNFVKYDVTSPKRQHYAEVPTSRPTTFSINLGVAIESSFLPPQTPRPKLSPMISSTASLARSMISSRSWNSGLSSVERPDIPVQSQHLFQSGNVSELQAEKRDSKIKPSAGNNISQRFRNIFRTGSKQTTSTGAGQHYRNCYNNARQRQRQCPAYRDSILFQTQRQPLIDLTLATKTMVCATPSTLEAEQFGKRQARGLPVSPVEQFGSVTGDSIPCNVAASSTTKVLKLPPIFVGRKLKQ